MQRPEHTAQPSKLRCLAAKAFLVVAQPFILVEATFRATADPENLQFLDGLDRSGCWADYLSNKISGNNLEGPGF